MKTKLIAGIVMLSLITGITMTSSHLAEARGMPIHNPNWSKIAADPLSYNGHAPACICPNKTAPKIDQSDHNTQPKIGNKIKSSDIHKDSKIVVSVTNKKPSK